MPVAEEFTLFRFSMDQVEREGDNFRREKHLPKVGLSRKVGVENALSQSTQVITIVLFQHQQSSFLCRGWGEEEPGVLCKSQCKNMSHIVVHLGPS